MAGAERPAARDFPPPQGRTLQQMATAIGGGGPELALATSVLTSGGTTRLAFGMIGPDGSAIYGKTAVYVAQGPDARAQGPIVAPADSLITDVRFRSKQAATQSDVFAAVYAAKVDFEEPGEWSVLAVTQQGARRVAAGTQVSVVSKVRDRIPDVGDKAPIVETDTPTSVTGDRALLDTRIPPAPALHRRPFADVIGRMPVALLFATPGVCESRVCGPVTDIALQMQAKYGARMEFIHQEVFVDNDHGKGLRMPLRRFRLQTEPWLFVVNREGRVTARLEGSFGLRAFEDAVKSAL